MIDKVIKTGYSFDDFSLIPQHSEIKSRKEPDVSTQIGNSNYKIPVISSPMNTVTEWEMIKAMHSIGGTGVLHRYMSLEKQLEQLERLEISLEFIVAIGATGDFLERAFELYKRGVRRFCIDVANGHSQICIDAVRYLRKKFGSSIDIMAGNVCSAIGTENLIKAGANIIRCGISVGSICSTRLVTGFGVPQLTAIEQCKTAICNSLEESKITLVADGGIRTSGDIVKSLAMGADAVMIGGLIAGTSQCPGETFKDIDGHLYKYYHGMASKEGRKEWFDKEATSFVPEGSSTKVSFKGDATKIIDNLVSGLKVGMSYCGAKNLQELYQKAEWIQVTQHGKIEGTINRKMYKRK